MANSAKTRSGHEKVSKESTNHSANVIVWAVSGKEEC